MQPLENIECKENSCTSTPREVGRLLGTSFAPMRRDQIAVVNALLTESMRNAEQRLQESHQREE